MADFLITECSQIDRHIEPRIEDLPVGARVPAKYEEVTLTLRLIGSGDTRSFTSEQLVGEIMKRLYVIEAPKE